MTQKLLDNSVTFSRARIKALLDKVGADLAANGVISEIAIYGGSAMTLLFDFREATQDVDYFPIKHCDEALKASAMKVAGEEGLPAHWFNDALAEVVSESYHIYYGDFPIENPGLRVFVGKPEYILAMKCVSLRSSMDTSDPFDVWHLMDACKIDSKEALFDLINDFLPNHPLSKRNKLILEDMLEAKSNGLAYDPRLGV